VASLSRPEQDANNATATLLEKQEIKNDKATAGNG
jgi:hypothetical protein